VTLAYIDCASGISGDMTLGALVDAGAELAAIQAGIDSLGLPSCRLMANEVKRQAFRAVQITVEYVPEHVHRHLHHITAMIDRSRLSPRQKDVAGRIFLRLAQAEAKVHGTTIEKVHFHEVGAVDSIADIVGTAIGWDLLNIDRLVVSPVPTGYGFVTIAHGRCSIPAPATAELLTGVPLAASDIEAELTTPTGAAILATLGDEFGPVPSMRITRIGYGAGSRDQKSQPNLLRLLLGEPAELRNALETVWTLETQLDDTSGELVGYCTGLLLEAGALDVYTTAVQMKKNRPGVLLTVLCHPPDVERLEAILFRQTPTLGVRRWPAKRRALARRRHEVATPWGPIDGVLWHPPGGPPGFSPEYETCRRAADGQNVPLRVVIEAAQRAFDPTAAGE
jgi:pyridinium-3,5-bisthiocarboxylic acid mononucleotide nickel chelatase